MTFNRLIFPFAVPLMLTLAVPAGPVLAQSRSTFENAMLAELDPAVRADVERRAVNGNTVIGVVGTILLNNYQAAGPRRPGRAVDVTAVDFSRGVVVLRRARNLFEVKRFDPRTLRLLR